MERSENNSRMVSSADLLRKGASLLREPCPKCGGLQIRYQGKTYCINEDNLDSVLSPKPEKPVAHIVQPVPKKEEEEGKRPQPMAGADPLRQLLEEKLGRVSKQLEETTDLQQQASLLDLISKYIETLERLKSKE